MRYIFIVSFTMCFIKVLYGDNVSSSTNKTPQRHRLSTEYHKSRRKKPEEELVYSEAHKNPPVFNFSRIASLLRSRGYDVFEPGDDMPIALLEQEMALPASRLLPELSTIGERGSHMIHATWRNKHGETIIYYFFDEKSKPHKELFEQAANSWGSETCIRFERTGHTSCKELVQFPSFCVGNFGGCWSFVGKGPWTGGKTGKGKSQRISVAGNCELDACIHEFGHGLGFQHQQSRPDRDAYVSINWENFKIINHKNWERKLQTTWTQGMRCDKKQVFDIPTPYDYLSVEHYGTFSFVDDDIRPTFVSKDVKYQWMIDYHRSRGMGPSHYDLYTINSAYKCTDLWHKRCSANGKTVTKCANYGYLNKDCKCRCPAGFTGSTCKESTGSVFPLMEKAKCFVEWHYPGIIDLGNMELDFVKRDYPNPSFNYMQFCTVIVDTLRSDARPIVWLDPSELLVQRRKLIELLHRNEFVTHVLPQLYLFDCRLFFKLFWTSNTNSRMRTECFSSIFNVGLKVTRAKMLMLRSKNQTLSMYFNVVYKWSKPYIDFLEAAVKLRVEVVFEKIPQKLLLIDKAYKESPLTSPGPTYLPPTIPVELRFETTTPNILGVALPMIFQDQENPRLAFIGIVVLVIGILLCTFCMGVCVSEQLQVKELLSAADRRAALNKDQESSNLLAAGWVRLRGVNVDDEVRKEKQEKRASRNWFSRHFTIDDSDSDTSRDREEAKRKRQLMKEKAQQAKEDGSTDSSADSDEKPKWHLAREKRLLARNEESGTDSSDDPEPEVKKRRMSLFLGNKMAKEGDESENDALGGDKSDSSDESKIDIKKRRLTLFRRKTKTNEESNDKDENGDTAAKKHKFSLVLPDIHKSRKT